MLRLARGRADRTLLAVALVLSAALCSMAANGATKYLSAGMSAQQILWIRDGVVLAVLIPLVWRAGRAGAVACAPDGLSCMSFAVCFCWEPGCSSCPPSGGFPLSCVPRSPT